MLSTAAEASFIMASDHSGMSAYGMNGGDARTLPPMPTTLDVGGGRRVMVAGRVVERVWGKVGEDIVRHVGEHVVWRNVSVTLPRRRAAGGGAVIGEHREERTTIST